MEANIEKIIVAGSSIPANFFKRSTWKKIECVMEFLFNEGLVTSTPFHPVKYRLIETVSMDRMVTAYMNSPFEKHFEAYKALGESLGLPLNSGELLKAFVELNIKD